MGMEPEREDPFLAPLPGTAEKALMVLPPLSAPRKGSAHLDQWRE